MKEINQKIIDAVIAKAKQVCPDSLALIGVYGSVATGDEYEKSDLDLLILIKDDEGWQLGTGFILEDNQVGYDIYCTNWDGLKYDSECHHAQLSKLMDSKIVYVNDQKAYDELLKLREKTKSFLDSDERFDRVGDLIKNAKEYFADLYLSDDPGTVRKNAFGVIYYTLDAIMLFHGDYYKRGSKRIFDELKEKNIDEKYMEDIKRISKSSDITEIRNCAKNILKYTQNHTCIEKKLREVSGEIADEIKGSYEEMFSNWRNKVEEAAENKDTVSSFMNMNNFNFMFSGILSELATDDIDIMGEYDPECLENNTRLYDKCLEKYQEIYQKAGVNVVRYKNVDEFVNSYLGQTGE